MIDEVGFHTHNGTDTPQVDPSNLLPFPLVSAIPTDPVGGSDIRIYSSSGTYRLYVRVSGTWRYTTLT